MVINMWAFKDLVLAFIQYNKNKSNTVFVESSADLAQKVTQDSISLI